MFFFRKSGRTCETSFQQIASLQVKETWFPCLRKQNSPCDWLQGLPFLFSRTMFHTQLIRHQGDELAVGGLFLGDRHTAAKGAVKGIDAPSAPRHLDGVSDGALHLAGAGTKAPRNGGIQFLRNAIDAVGLLDHQLDGLAEELIALDVRGNAKAQENITLIGLQHDCWLHCQDNYNILLQGIWFTLLYYYCSSCNSEGQQQFQADGASLPLTLRCSAY